MNDKPWWLWVGALVQYKNGKKDKDWTGKGEVFYVADPSEEGKYCIGILPVRHINQVWCPVDEVLPVTNPAVMLAPEDATHVKISGKGHVEYRDYDKDLDNGDWGPTIRDHAYQVGGQFKWLQCPDHLKGKTWPLPKQTK